MARKEYFASSLHEAEKLFLGGKVRDYWVYNREEEEEKTTQLMERFRETLFFMKSFANLAQHIIFLFVPHSV